MNYLSHVSLCISPRCRKGLISDNNTHITKLTGHHDILDEHRRTLYEPSMSTNADSRWGREKKEEQGHDAKPHVPEKKPHPNITDEVSEKEPTPH